MFRCLLGGLVVLIVARDAAAWGSGSLRVCLAQHQPGYNQGILQLREIYATPPFFEEATIERNVGGVPVQEKVRIRRTNVSESITEISLQAVTVYDTDNNAIKAEALPELFRRERPAVLSTHGKKIDPPYLKALKKGTLIIVVPFAAYPNAPYPAYGGYNGGPPAVPAPSPKKTR